MASLVLLISIPLGCTGTIGDGTGVGPDPEPVDSGAVGTGDAAAGSIDARDPEVDAALPVDGASPSSLNAAELDLLDALNQARADNGLAPVAVEMRLMCAERKHALDVGETGECGHVGTDGSWPWDRAEACGFPQDSWTVNEIAAGPGFTDGADAVWGWSQSSGHWAAIVDPDATLVGVAVHNTCFFALFDCCVAGSD